MHHPPPSAAVAGLPMGQQPDAGEVIMAQAFAARGRRQWTEVDEDTLVASRLVGTNTAGQFVSISNLASWVGGTANQITATDDGDGTVTLALSSTIVTPGTLAIGNSDTLLQRASAGVLEQRSGTQTQTFNLYDTYISAGNYRRLSFSFSTGWIIAAQYVTQTAPYLHFIGGDGLLFTGNAGTGAGFEVTSAGHLIPSSDGVFDLGGSSDQWRSIYAGTSIVNAGYYRGGTATDANAAGDWSSGLTGANRAWYDQSTQRMYYLGAATAYSGFVDPGSNVATDLSVAEAASTITSATFTTRFNRLTNTTGAVVVRGFQGNGTSTISWGIACNAAGLETVFNEAALDINYRVETQTLTHAIYADAGVNGVSLLTSTVSAGTVTIGGHVLLSADNTYDIGASGATRPRTGYFGTSVNVVAGAVLLDTNGITMGDAKNVILNTTTGTKIGTATTQKLGFWNATPVVQAAGIVDADGTLADITTKFNTLLATMEAYGLLGAA